MTLTELLTHHGLISYADYFAVVAANIVTILYQGYQAQVNHPKDFSLKVLCHENTFRWLLSFSASLFLLYVIPEGYFWYATEFMAKDSKALYWNTLFSALIGLSPLYILKKLIKVSRSKFRGEIEK